MLRSTLLPHSTLSSKRSLTQGVELAGGAAWASPVLGIAGDELGSSESSPAIGSSLASGASVTTGSTTAGPT
eukprot:8039310-Alexandrium_andersonii.AAC.1